MWALWGSCALARCLALAPAAAALRASVRNGAIAGSPVDGASSAEVRPLRWEPIGSTEGGVEWLHMHNVCLTAESVRSLLKTPFRTGAPSEMAALPAGSPGTQRYARVNGTVLVLIVHHGLGSDFGWKNVAHVAQEAFPMLRALKALGEEVDAVLAWQMDRPTVEEETFYPGVVQILGRHGLKTPLFTREDVSPGTGVCADDVIRAAPPEGTGRFPWFTDEASRLDYRQRALDALGLQPRTLPECKAVVVLRPPPQGIANRDAVERRLGAFMSEAGWGLTVWRSDRWGSAHSKMIGFGDQVEMFHEAALSIMVHGAENVNMVWQPPKAGIVLVRKCGDGGGLLLELAGRSLALPTYPANCTIRHPPFHNYTVNENAMYYMDVDGDLLPTLRLAMRLMEERSVCRAVGSLGRAVLK